MQQKGVSAESGNAFSTHMFGSMPQPAHLPCPSCGASVPRDTAGHHLCDEEQRARYERFQARVEVDRFDAELTTWLATPAGRFEVFYAERARRAA
jgi:hypothetical protein